MKVTIDGTVLAGARGGVRRYVAGLVESLPRLDRTNRYRIMFRAFRAGRRRALARLLAAGEVRADLIRRLYVPDRMLEQLWHQWDVPLPAGRWLLGGCDVFLDTWYLVPRLHGTRLVTIVYDLLPLRVPDAYPTFHEIFRRKLQQAIDRAAVLVAISESTKADLSAHFGVGAERLRVVYPGIETRFCPDGDAADRAALKAYGVQAPYILYVGSSHPNKRLAVLVEAFRLVREQWHVPHTLVLCGTDRDGGHDLSGAKELPIVTTGFVPDEVLPLLYRCASAFVWLPAVEGFGLPAAEAMASGVPVIVAEAAATREVVGDAGMYVDATDGARVADGLYRVLSDEQLRRGQIARGLKRSGRFTWARAAEQMRDVIRGLA